jgi:hypothetical protein
VLLTSALGDEERTALSWDALSLSSGRRMAICATKFITLRENVDARTVEREGGLS